MKKFLLLACLGFPLPVFAQGGLPDKPYIYVEGKAEVEKPADLATLRFDLVARNADQTKANQEVQSKANRIFGLLNQRKIAPADVIASDIKSEPQFEKGDDYKRGKVTGYSVTRTFTVAVRDIATFASIVDELLTVGGLEFSSIDPGLVKEKELRDEMFDKALANARERAEKISKAMDTRIESIFAISPAAFSEIRSRIFGADTTEATTERVVVTGSYIPAGGAPNPVVSEYRLAPLKVSQTVHVIYLIAPAR